MIKFGKELKKEQIEAYEQIVTVNNLKHKERPEGK